MKYIRNHGLDRCSREESELPSDRRARAEWQPDPVDIGRRIRVIRGSWSLDERKQRANDALRMQQALFEFSGLAAGLDRQIVENIEQAS